MTSATPFRVVDSKSFETLRQTWLGTLSANTRLAYGSDLESFSRWSGVLSGPLAATTDDVSMFQRACLDRGESPSTVRRRSSALASFFQFAVAEQVLGVNPVVGSDRPDVLAGDPSVTLCLVADFVERYLTGAEHFDERLHALSLLLACDGLKLGEALALNTDDLTGRSPGVIARVHRAGETQQVVLGRRSSVAVRRCAGGRRHEPLFISKPRSISTDAHRRLTRFGADHLFKQVPGPDGGSVTSNELRRFFINSADQAGTHIDTIRRRAGIGDRRSARRYLTPSAASPDEQVSHQTSVDHGSDRRSITKEV